MPQQIVEMIDRARIDPEQIVAGARSGVAFDDCRVLPHSALKRGVGIKADGD